MRYVIANGLETVNGKTVIKKCRYATLPSVLPNGYTQVKYLESTGTQYINTGLKASNNAGIDIEYSQLAPNSAGIFGCRGGSGTFWLSQQSAGNLYAFEFSGNSGRITFNDGVAYNTGYHNIIVRQNKIIYDGVQKATYINSANSSLDIYLFRTNENGSPYSGACSGRLKYCKLYNGTTLMRDLVPCIRNSDNKPGMYDKVNNVFYTNQGTGEFIYETLNNIYSSETRTVRVSDSGVGGNGWSEANLSETSFSANNNYTSVIYEFTETGFNIRPSNIEFLNGSGFQLPFKVIGNREYRLTFNYDGPNVAREFWYYDQSGAKIGSASFTSDTTITVPADAIWVVFNFRTAATEDFVHYTNVRFEHKSSPISSVAVSPRLPDEYQEVEYIEGDGNQFCSQQNLNIEVSGDLTVCYKFAVNEHTDAMYFSTITASGLSAGQAYSLGYTGAASDLYIRWNQVQSNETRVDYTIPEVKEVTRTNNVSNVILDYVSLFAHGGNYKPWKGKIYKYWLKINNVYIFNWIPCYRKSDKVIGLYDLVSRTFVTNIGTGAFLVGDDIIGGGYIMKYGYNQGFKHLASNVEFRVPGNILPDMTITRDDESNTITCNFLNSNHIGQAFYGFCPMFNVGDRCLLTFEVYSTKITIDGISLYSGVTHTDETYEKYTSKDLGTWKRVGQFATYTSSWATTNSMYYRFVNCGSHVAGDILIIKNIEFFNLTELYGAGNEPATMEEFKQTFNKKYYPYCKDVKMLSAIDINNLGVD